MSEHDGLTAEQEARRRYKVVVQDVAYQDVGKQKERGFIEGAEWATEREKARAEAAEARVAELEGLLRMAEESTASGEVTEVEV